MEIGEPAKIRPTHYQKGSLGRSSLAQSIDWTKNQIITNAILFTGKWQSQFKPDQTRQGPFQVNAREKVTVALMSQVQEFKHLECENFQMLEMPYVGKSLTRVLLLPRTGNDLADLEKTLTLDKLSGWLADLRVGEVDVTLPRFRVRSEFELAPDLAALVMPRAFTDQAEFSGMADSRGELARLRITGVIHQAVVEVQEDGTVAAAATAVVGSGRAPPAASFRADHPFLFLIRDTRTGSILFLGRLVNPGG